MGVTDTSRNVHKYQIFDWKRDGVGEEYGINSIAY